SKIILPAKIKILSNYIFRRSNPIIVGVKIISGVIKPGFPLIMENGRRVGEIMQIQEHGKVLKEAIEGMEVAISIRSNMIIGRQIKENEILYTDIPNDQMEILIEKFRNDIGEEGIKLIKEIKKIKKRAY
ncbi:MAG: translation initiation factor IF-2, partial [Thermoprotei archaeon]